MTAHRHAAVVLAAGGSRRLGRPKSLLRRDGRSLIERVLDMTAATAPQRLLVVLGGHLPRIEPAVAVATPDAERVINDDWEEGLASSLRLAAHALAAFEGPVLIVGCDQPALSPEHLHALLQGAATAFSGCAATRHGERPGIPAVIAPALMARAADLQGDRGFGPWLAQYPPGAVWSLDDPALRLDLDTPADVAAAIAQGLLDADQLG